MAKTKQQKNAEAVISIQAKLDKANNAIEDLKTGLAVSEKARKYWITESKKRKQGEKWLQADLDKANTEIERLNKTFALVSNQLRLMALCLGGE